MAADWTSLRANAEADIALALQQCGDAAVVVIGDLSGIQRFIYAVAGPDSSGGGIARRLRARSIQLSALSYSFALDAVEGAGVGRECILTTSGGNFMLLLPAGSFNSSDFRRRAEQWLWSRTWGELWLNLGVSGPFTPDLTGLPSALAQASTDLAARKATPWMDVIAEHVPSYGGAYESSVFNVAYDAECRSCHKLPITIAGADFCPMCQMQNTLARKVVRAAGAVGTPMSLGSSGDLEVFGGRIGVATDGGDFTVDTFAPTYAEIVQPPGEDEEETHTADFDALAAAALGADKIAVLAVDVDNLGLLMSDQGRPFADTLALSRALSEFFGARLLQRHVMAFPPCYLFYAGGDDVMLLGPWDRVLDLACALREDFHATFGAIGESLGLRRPLTISAGVAIDAPHTPISDVAARAHEYLEDAKDAGDPRGDRIKVGAVCCGWETCGELLEFAQELSRRTELPAGGDDGHVSRGFVHSLYDIMDLCDQWLEQGAPEGLRYKGLLVGAMERNKIPVDVRDILGKLLLSGGRETTRAFRLCLDWVSLAGRG